MSNFLDEISWFMNLWKPDHRAEDAVFDLMVKDIQQNLKEQKESPQETLTADNFFAEVQNSQEKANQKYLESRKKKLWDKKTLIKNVQDALKEAVNSGSNYIMIECDCRDTAEINLMPVKEYLTSLGFNANSLVSDTVTGALGHYWYIKGHLRKCVN